MLVKVIGWAVVIVAAVWLLTNARHAGQDVHSLFNSISDFAAGLGGG